MARKKKAPAPEAMTIRVTIDADLFDLDLEAEDCDPESNIDEIVWEEVRQRISFSWERRS